MQNLMTSLDLENETQKRQIQELEQFVILLSGALTTEQIPSSFQGLSESFLNSERGGEEPNNGLI